ncbi:hypothetical protein ACOSQ3_013091 [Xanthoceras sorbifolium]
MDHPHKILKLDGSNYSSWSYWMCNCVFKKELLELVNGSVTKPGPKDKKFRELLKKWEAKNAQVLSLINDSVDPGIKKRLAVFKSAKDAWNYLARLYAHSTLAENFQLEMDMRAISQGDRSIQELHGILVSFWDKLAMMEPKDLSGLDSFKKYREEQRLVQLLIALRDDFEPLRRSILQRSTFPSVQEAVEELITEERRVKSLLVSSKHEKLVPPPQPQLESLSLNPQIDHQVARNQCTGCHQTGHSMLKCPEKFKNDKNKLTVKSYKASDQFGRCQPTGRESIQKSCELYQPMSSKSRSASSSTLDADGQPASFDGMQSYFFNVNAQVERDFFGESPLETGCYLPPSKRYGGYGSSNMEPMQLSSKHHQPVQPSSETSRPASRLTPDNDDEPILPRDKFRSMVKLVAQIHSDFGESPLESACYLPDSDEEDYNSSTSLSTLKILSYNVWFREDIEVHKRMESIGSLIQLHSPDVICFQEVTRNIYDIFKQSNWWDKYNCSVSDEMACTRRYFCMQLSTLPVKSFVRVPFSNSRMGRELCMAEIEVKGVEDPLIVATSHLESPKPQSDQMHSRERVAQAKEVLSRLIGSNSSPNMIFCSDMNWDDDLEGRFPLFGGWIDAWEELRPGEDGWTFDTKSNPMLVGNWPLQKRLDRFICNLCDFKLDAIEMIGKEAIPGVTYCKGKQKRKMELPVLPSDHYGLLLHVGVSRSQKNFGF